MLYTQLPTYAGVMRLSDLMSDKKVLGVFESNSGLITAPADVRFISIKNLPVYSVTTESGAQYTVQSVVSVPCDDVEPVSGPPESGSFLLTFRSVYDGIKDPLEGKAIVQHFGGRQFILDDVPRTKDIGWMFGVFLGVGGFIGKSGGTAVVQRAPKREGVSLLWSAIVSSMADVTPATGCTDKNGYDRHMRVSNGTFCRWMRKMVGASAKERKLPPGTLLSTEEFRAGVFLGLFETRSTIRVAPRNVKVSLRIKRTDPLHQEVLFLCRSLGMEVESQRDGLFIRPDTLCVQPVRSWMTLSAKKEEQYDKLIKVMGVYPSPADDAIPCPSKVVNFLTSNVLMAGKSHRFVEASVGGVVRAEDAIPALVAINSDAYLLKNLPAYMKRWCSMAIEGRFGYDRITHCEELGSMSVRLPGIAGGIGCVMDGIIHTVPNK